MPREDRTSPHNLGRTWFRRESDAEVVPCIDAPYRVVSNSIQIATGQPNSLRPSGVHANKRSHELQVWFAQADWRRRYIRSPCRRERAHCQAPRKELDAFLERAQRVSCPLREILFEIGEPFERVLFPLTGMGSLVTVLKDGTTLEAQAVGREGFVGLPLFHGIPVARTKGICQIEGEFYQMAPDDFISLLTSFLRVQEDPSPVRAVRQRSHRTDRGVQQHAPHRATLCTVAAPERGCSRQERISVSPTSFFPRCSRCVDPESRWRSADSSGRGLIEHRYGKVSLRDVEGLKKVACECYQTITEKSRELLA